MQTVTNNHDALTGQRGTFSIGKNIHQLNSDFMLKSEKKNGLDLIISSKQSDVS